MLICPHNPAKGTKTTTGSTHLRNQSWRNYLYDKKAIR
jgi:hypothetical protein